jgi:DNA-binding CsgD family transcriptional regulator/uncharacterized protein YkwD
MTRDLTPRQAQILDLVAIGLGDKEIAGKLGVSTNTVRTHLQRLYRDRGIRNRAEAAVTWAAQRSQAVAVVADLAPVAAPPPSSAQPQGLRLRFGLALVLALTLLPVAGYEVSDKSRLILATVSGPRPAIPLDAAAIVAPTSNSVGPTSAVSAQPTSVAATAGSTAAGTPAVSATPAPAGVASLPAAPTSTSGAPDAPTVMPALAQLALVNSARALAGLPLLAWDNCLENVAAQSAQLVAGQGYITGTSGPTRALACAGTSRSPAETAGYWSAPDDARLNSMSLSQPTAKAKILGPYKKMGAAWALSPNGIAYLVTEFG